MDRDMGKGPFKASADELIAETHPAGAMLVILDAAGNRFAYVALEDCVGGDLPAAKARATRIAEALNQREGHGAPTPYIDHAGNLRAPAGYGFVSGGEGCEMVTLTNVSLVNVSMVPAKAK